MDGIHVIAARVAVLRAADAAVDAEWSPESLAALADAVATMRRAQRIRSLYTCAECGLGVIVRPSGETVRGCSHADATILGHGVARGAMVATAVG